MSEREKTEKSIGAQRERKKSFFTFLATSSGTLPPKPSAVATRPPPAGAREESAALPPPPPSEVRFFSEVEDILFILFRLQKNSSPISQFLSLATTSSLSKEGAREPASVRALGRDREKALSLLRPTGEKGTESALRTAGRKTERG